MRRCRIMIRAVRLVSFGPGKSQPHLANPRPSVRWISQCLVGHADGRIRRSMSQSASNEPTQKLHCDATRILRGRPD